jgi:hypothetical protein
MLAAKRLLKRLTDPLTCALLGHEKWHVHPPGMGPPLLWGFDFWTGKVARWRSFDACLRCGSIFLSGVSTDRPWPETEDERRMRGMSTQGLKPVEQVQKEMAPPTPLRLDEAAFLEQMRVSSSLDTQSNQEGEPAA